MNEREVEIDYTNWRGHRAVRRIKPDLFGIVFGVNEWHKEPQWLLSATLSETGEKRTFAMKDIHSWKQLDA